MSISIVDGRTHDTVKIDKNNRMHTSAVTAEECHLAGEIGQKFNINTGDITLTDANKTSILYVKNTGNDDLVITFAIYNLGATANGTGDALIEILRNPTAGDIITNANNVSIGPLVNANQNFGSTNVLTGLFYKGATSEGVFTDGLLGLSLRSAPNTGRIKHEFEIIVLPKGHSLGIDYTPPASNTSQIVQFELSCFVATEAIHG